MKILHNKAYPSDLLIVQLQYTMPLISATHNSSLEFAEKQHCPSKNGLDSKGLSCKNICLLKTSQIHFCLGFRNLKMEIHEL